MSSPPATATSSGSAVRTPSGREALRKVADALPFQALPVDGEHRIIDADPTGRAGGRVDGAPLRRALVRILHAIFAQSQADGRARGERGRSRGSWGCPTRRAQEIGR